MDFFRTWIAYKQGFGSQLGEFWLGVNNITPLTAQEWGHGGGSVVGGAAAAAPTLPWAVEQKASPSSSHLTAGRLCLCASRALLQTL